jgi:hypothetical protein
MTVTDLYFGQSRAAQADIPRSDWNDFVSREIAPRFDGFTISRAVGYWKGQRERTYRVTFAHANSPDDNARLEDIRDAYRKRFTEDSVMRADAQQHVTFA